MGRGGAGPCAPTLPFPRGISKFFFFDTELGESGCGSAERDAVEPGGMPHGAPGRLAGDDFRLRCSFPHGGLKCFSKRLLPSLRHQWATARPRGAVGLVSPARPLGAVEVAFATAGRTLCVPSPPPTAAPLRGRFRPLRSRRRVPALAPTQIATKQKATPME